MEFVEILEKCENFLTRAIVSLYLNVSNVKQYWSFVSWSIDTSHDVLFSNPDLIDKEPEFIDMQDEGEALEKFEELRVLFYNQLFVILYSYTEIFINDFIEDIYCTIDGIKKNKKNIIKGNMKEKIRFISSLVDRNDDFWKKMRDGISRCLIIRNAITHNQSKVADEQRGLIPDEIVNEKNKIALTEKYFEKFAEDLMSYCIEINNEVVKNNPKLLTSQKNKEISSLLLKSLERF